VKAEFAAGKVSLEFALDDLCCLIRPEDRDEFLQVIASEDAVIRHVMSQVLTGMTEDGYSGRSSGQLESWDEKYPSALDQARRDVFRFADAVLRTQFEVAVSGAKRMEALQQEALEALRQENREVHRQLVAALAQVTELERQLYLARSEARALCSVAGCEVHGRP